MLLLMVTFGAESTNSISKAFADNCVNARSGCRNAGTGSIQYNNCVEVGECFNIGVGSIQDNNCRSTSTCSNHGDGSIQTNNCAYITKPEGRKSRSGCDNNGLDSIQINNCALRSAGLCANRGVTSIQVNDCANSPGCGNAADEALGNNQYTSCQKTNCNTHSFSTSNMQTTECNSADSCTNIGDHTTVLANGAAC